MPWYVVPIFRPGWTRYAIDVPAHLAAAAGLYELWGVSPGVVFSLIPVVHYAAYVAGPLERVDAGVSGALYNTVLPGEQAHVA